MEQKLSNKVTHLFGMDLGVVVREIGDHKLHKFKGVSLILNLGLLKGKNDFYDFCLTLGFKRLFVSCYV